MDLWHWSHILADLIAEGCSGQELLNEFKECKAKVRPSIELLPGKAGEAAHRKDEGAVCDEIF